MKSTTIKNICSLDGGSSSDTSRWTRVMCSQRARLILLGIERDVAPARHCSHLPTQQKNYHGGSSSTKLSVRLSVQSVDYRGCFRREGTLRERERERELRVSLMSENVLMTTNVSLLTHNPCFKRYTVLHSPSFYG